MFFRKNGSTPFANSASFSSCILQWHFRIWALATNNLDSKIITDQYVCILCRLQLKLIWILNTGSNKYRSGIASLYFQNYDINNDIITVQVYVHINQRSDRNSILWATLKFHWLEKYDIYLCTAFFYIKLQSSEKLASAKTVCIHQNLGNLQSHKRDSGAFSSTFRTLHNIPCIWRRNRFLI